MAETQRELAPEAKVKILHEGREGVERVVAVVRRGKRSANTEADSYGMTNKMTDKVPTE